MSDTDVSSPPPVGSDPTSTDSATIGSDRATPLHGSGGGSDGRADTSPPSDPSGQPSNPLTGPSRQPGRPASESRTPPSGIAGLVRAMDDEVDRWFEPLRGNPTLDGAAKLITGLGDHGLMWAATTVWRIRHRGPDRARSVRALTIAGLESSLVNAGIKQLVGRARPDSSNLGLSEGGVPVRAPKTSSFPSGHTLAAFCAATVMSKPGDRAGNALLFTSATLVGLSRLHLGAHHASDVLGGVAIGTALGLVGRRFV
jgi:undecaprenyl-diphosphatase